MIFKINNTDFSDFVSGLKEDYETLVSEESGRNAAGYMSFDIIGHKYKVSVTFRPMFLNDIAALMAQLKQFSMTIEWSSTDGTTHTANVYTGTPSVDWHLYNDRAVTKPFTLSFIEV